MQLVMWYQAVTTAVKGTGKYSIHRRKTTQRNRNRDEKNPVYETAIKYEIHNAKHYGGVIHSPSRDGLAERYRPSKRFGQD